MVRRKNSPLYDSFLLCRNSIRKDLSHTAHKRRNARFNGLWWVNTPPHPPNRAQRLTRRNAGYFRWGCYLYPRSVLRGSENLRGRVSEPRTLPLSGLGQVCSRRVQRACGTAMCLCVSLFRRRRGPAGLRDPVAVPLTALIGFTILLSRIVAHRKLSACSLVTAVRFLNRYSRRSMRETYPLGQRSGCRF